MVSTVLVGVLVVVSIIVILIIIYAFFIAKIGGTTSATGQTFRKCTDPPGTPNNVQLLIASSNAIQVSWNAVSGADIYRIYISKHQNFSLTDADVVASTGTLSTTFTELDTGFIYYVKVTAFNSCGESIPSVAVSIVLPYAYANKFVIQNRDDSVVQVSMGGTTRNVMAQACAVANCGYFFDTIDSTIRLESSPNACLTVVSGNELWTIPCTSSSLANRQWAYDATDGSLCLAGSNGNSCVVTPPGFSDPAGFGQFTLVAPKTNNTRSAWTLRSI